MNSDLTALRNACHARGVVSDSAKVSDGESLRLIGLPVTTEEGYIGLSMGEGHSVIVSESSILEVTKDKDRYVVHVKSGTTALVRFEAVTTLRNPECSCSEVGTASSPAPGFNPRPGFGLTFIVCRVRQFCGSYIDSSGNPQLVCVPGLVCVSANV